MQASPPSPPQLQRHSPRPGEDKPSPEVIPHDTVKHQGMAVSLPVEEPTKALPPSEATKETAAPTDQRKCTPFPCPPASDHTKVKSVTAEAVMDKLNAVFAKNEIPSAITCVKFWSPMAAKASTSTYGSILQLMSWMDEPCKNPRPDGKPPAIPTEPKIQKDMEEYCQQYPEMATGISFVESFIKADLLTVTDRTEKHMNKTGLDYVHLRHVHLATEELEKLQAMMPAPTKNEQTQSAWHQEPESYTEQQQKAGYSGVIQPSNFFGEDDDIGAGYRIKGQLVASKDEINNFIHTMLEIPMRRAKLNPQNRDEFIRFVSEHFQESTTDTEKIIKLVSKYFTS